MGALLKSKLFIAVAVIAALIGLYALVGFKLAPGFVRNKAIEYVRAEHGRELSIGEVRIHPFKLQLEVRDIAFPDADGTRMLGLDRVFVDFDVSSLWKRAFFFREVDLESPYVHAVIRPDGAMNLAELAPKAPPAEAPEDDEPPRVWIAELVVEGGVVDFLDRARRRPYQRRFAPVTFTLEDFKTTPEGGDFRLSARSQADERLDWKGHFALAPVVQSEGDFAIFELRATNVGELLGEALPFGLAEGTIDLRGRYRLALGDTTELDLTLPAIDAAGLSLRARGVEESWIRVPTIVVSDTALAIPAHTVEIGRVAVNGLVAQAWLDKDGSVNLERLFAPAPPTAAPTEPEPPATAATKPSAAKPRPVRVAVADPDAPRPAAAGKATEAAAAPAASEPASAPAPAAPASEPSQEWTVRIVAVELADARIDLQDRTMTPATEFALAPVDLRMTNLTLDTHRPVPVTVTAMLDGKTPLEASGTIVPDPFAADLDVEVQKFDLRKLQPYVSAATDMTIRRGTARAGGKLTMTPAGDKDADLAFAGDVRVDGFRSIDDLLEEDFINFQRLDLRKLRFAMAPDALSIDRAVLREPYARISISPEQVLNVAAVFDPEGTATALAERKAQEAADAEAESESKSRAADRAKAAPKPKKDKEDMEDEAPPPREVLVETGMPIRIREVRIESGEMNFSDQFIKPNFAADITGLEGTFTGLSTDPNSSAKVDMKGAVGEFSPVTIAGEIQIFAFDRHTDVGMKFENIPLPVFNPYSGRFAGYNIAKGSLTTDLRYLIEDRALDAQHHVRIDQLEWGEPTDSKEAVPLPIKFATSLLKDVDGVIDLDVPVTGTLDDPKFRLGPIIWKIIKNILVKAVTAPFRLFGAMFKGAEEAQFVQFAPGEATLDAAVAENIAALARGLAQKKEIKLDVPIGALDELDRPALLERQLAVEVDAAAREVLRIKPDEETAVPELASLEPKQQIKVLSTVVENLTGAAPHLPPPPERPEGTSRKDYRALEDTAAVQALEQQARAAVVVDPAALQRLGQARGEAIQSALLSGGELEPERVFLARNDKVTAQDGKVRYELEIK